MKKPWRGSFAIPMTPSRPARPYRRRPAARLRSNFASNLASLRDRGAGDGQRILCLIRRRTENQMGAWQWRPAPGACRWWPTARRSTPPWRSIMRATARKLARICISPCHPTSPGPDWELIHCLFQRHFRGSQYPGVDPEHRHGGLSRATRLPACASRSKT